MDDKLKRRNEDRRLKLDVIQSYGSLCSMKLKDSISIIEDDYKRLLYPVGKFITQKYLDKTDMNFIRLSDSIDQISCMATSPNKKYLAVAEKIKGESVPQLSIYNLKATQNRIEAEKRIFKYSESKSSAFVGLAFSHSDSRFLLCLTGAPDFQLLFLDLARMKPLASQMIGMEITRISISPKDNHLIAASGKNYFKILRVQENSFINVSETVKRLSPNQVFTDHAWFEDNKVILANDRGEVFVINDSDVKQYINCGFSDIYGLGITCLIAFSKGFIIGSDNGYFALWVKSDDKEKSKTDDGMELAQDLYFLKKWRTERKSSIISMDITKNDDMLAVAFSNNDICTIEMGQILPTSSELLETFKNNDKYLKKEVKFDFLFNGFHNAPITHMDVCLQRPLIVTASKYDGTIRIWNYTIPRCELARKFYQGEDGNQQALGAKDNQGSAQDISPLCSVGFHPSGYYIAAGFIDKLRIFHVLHSELKTYKEIGVKNCTQVKFSNGGNLLAAAYPRAKSNHYQINVYDSYTLEFMHTLKGHTNQITDIVWGLRDQFIATCGLDGGIFEWNTQDWTRKDYAHNNNKYSSLIYDQPIGMLIAAGTENFKDKQEQDKVEQKSIVREQRIVQNGLSQGKDQHVHDLGLQKVTQINFIQSLYNQYGIVGGTDYGQLKIYSYIFNQLAFETLSIHQGEVTKIRSSPDGRYVFSAGSDGSIFVFQVSEISYDGQIFASKVAGEAKDQLEDLDKINPKVGVVDDILADVVLVSRNEVETYISELKKLQNELYDLDQNMDTRLTEERKRFEKEKKDLEYQYRAQLEDAEIRRKQLEAQKTKAENEMKSLIKNYESNHLKAVEELENLYERKLAFENEKYLQLEQQLMEERMKNQSQIKEFEKKHTSYIEMLKNQFKENFLITEKALDNNKSQADKLKLTYEEILAQQEEDHEYEIRLMNDTQKSEVDKLKTEIANQKSRLEAQKTNLNQLTEQLDTLKSQAKEKDNQIELLQQKFKEAENKIESLAKELEDRDEQIRKKEKKIYEYKYKISDLQKSKHVLSYRTTEMRKQLEPKEDQIVKLKEELFKLESEFAAMLKAQKALKDKGLEMQSQIDTLTINLNAQTETTSKKENLIQQITMDVHNCVHFKDEKEWIKEMKQLYQQYVLMQEIKARQHDPRSIDEMSRHVNHLEKSAIQINKSTEKMMLRRDKEIYKRMNENQQLIHELNEIRKHNKDYATEISNKTIELDKLRKENAKQKQELSYLKSKLSKYLGDSSNNLDMNEELIQQAPQSLLPNTINPSKQGSAQARLSSVPLKGKLFKGANYDKGKQQPFEIARASELMTQLQLAAQKNQQLEQMIKTLKKVLREKGIEDPYNEDDLNDSQFGRPQSQGFGRNF